MTLLANTQTLVQTPAPASDFRKQLQQLVCDVENARDEVEDVAAQCGFGGLRDDLKEIARRAAVADATIRPALEAAQRFEQAAFCLEFEAEELVHSLWALQDATAA